MKAINEDTIWRKRLIERQGELQHRLEHVSRDVRHAEGLEGDFAEQAVQRENDDVLERLDDAIRAEITQIDAALARLNGGKYGICETCHQPISAKRLEALPYAARCVKCG